MNAEDTVIPALNNALSRRVMHNNTIFHSDRGVQYSCNEFREVLTKITTKQSMSRKGNCWDNAVAESFFSSFKKECIRKKTFYSKKVAEQEILSYIEWYNNERLHSSLGYKSPLIFETNYRKMNRAK